MARSSKKPRKKKMNPDKYFMTREGEKKKERDWTFEDILRSKPHRR